MFGIISDHQTIYQLQDDGDLSHQYILELTHLQTEFGPVDLAHRQVIHSNQPTSNLDLGTNQAKIMLQHDLSSIKNVCFICRTCLKLSLFGDWIPKLC